MNIKKLLRMFSLIIIVSGISFFSYNVGFFAGQENILKTPPPQIISEGLEKKENVNFSIFWEAWRKLENNFLEKDNLNEQKMVYGAIDGMTKSLGDPYTTFFTPRQTNDFNEELSGKYDGVGMYVGIKDEQLTVIAPLKGAPAEKAGLKAGDKILKIGDVDTKDISVEEAVKLIKGPKKTEVKLLIYRKSFKEAKEFSVKRESIELPNVDLEIIKDDIVLVKIYQFNQLLPSEFAKKAAEIINSGNKKIILDLRNNPGGYLEVAQQIAGWFLKEGDVITWQDGGKEKGKKSYKSNGPAAFLKYPTVVLINEGSASASEILAGALRDQRDIKLIGGKSFGKGSVQEQINLSDKSSLKITVAKWLTPKGTSIDKNGLEPDIKVEAPNEEPENIENTENEENKDIQLEKAIEFIKDLKAEQAEPLFGGLF